MATPLFNTPLGCPAFVPGFPLCGHGRFLLLLRADMTRIADLVAAMIQQRKRLRFVLSSI
ncbi:hypothetical protein [Sphingomonas aquatilis]